MFDTPNRVLAVAESLAIPQHSFRQSSPVRWERVFVAILERFTRGGRANRHRWLWDDLIEPIKYVHVSPERFEEFLSSLGNEEDPVFLLIEDGTHAQKKESAHWVFEGRLGSAIQVLGQLPPSEFYIVGQNMEWLVAFNHHDLLIATGEHAINALSSVDAA